MLDAATLAAAAAESIAALASHYAVVNGAVRVPVIFDPNGGLLLGIEANSPTVRFAAADWPAPEQGDVLDIGDVRYVLTGKREGVGDYIGILQKQ